ncbi:hypothetical protein [Halarchaeum nitratireducens]|uniref:Uncharacterized protein n=1 Tax=Halarchaeum nitratireducens TaxID=489913 RepID=A0A830GCD0_9EURY|nr:hypothetical protein [Halarchaeum nitratireducens]GGN17861.1 hypothetical protein GCM10009021_18430 [Halarchaeum nitratireducens]
MPSKKANQYGTLAERKACERYRLRREGVHTSWRDAVQDDGTPVEIKATDASRDYPRFKVFEEYHDRLAAAGGKYVFVLYRRRGRGLTVLRMQMLPATQIPVSTWYTNGGHRDSKETKIRPGDVF